MRSLYGCMVTCSDKVDNENILTVLSLVCLKSDIWFPVPSPNIADYTELLFLLLENQWKSLLYVIYKSHQLQRQ